MGGGGGSAEAYFTVVSWGGVWEEWLTVLLLVGWLVDVNQAELRQKAHIQAIARKAENESSKVKEVSFINNLTAEDLRKTLTERLIEVLTGPHPTAHHAIRSRERGGSLTLASLSL